MTIENQIESLGSSFDNVLHESFEDRIIYMQVAQKFKPENDAPLTKNRYQASVLLCNGNIISMLRCSSALPGPNHKILQKFVHFDKLIALSAQLESDPEFDKFQHYTRAQLYQRIGDYLIYSQKNMREDEIDEDMVHMCLVAYSLALEHFQLLNPTGNDVLSGAAALSILEVHALLSHNIMRVEGGIAAVKNLRNNKDIGKKLLRLFTDEKIKEGNSFLLSDAPFRANIFNGVPLIDKANLVKVMWGAVGKHNFLERIAWLFANDTYYADCNYSFIDDWLNSKDIVDLFDGDYVVSRKLTKIDVKMFLYGLSEWTRMTHKKEYPRFQRNSFLVSMPAEPPIDVQIRFWDSIVQADAEIDNRRQSVLSSKMNLVKGLESLHLLNPQNTDRRLLHSIMMFVSRSMEKGIVPEKQGFQILFSYADQILMDIKNDPYCEKAKSFMNSTKFDKHDLMSLVHPTSTAEVDDVMKSDASYALARYFLSHEDYVNAEKYAKMVDEERTPMKRWMENLYQAWVTAEVNGDRKQILEGKLKEAEEAAKKVEEEKPKEQEEQPADLETTCNDSFHTVAESLSNTLNNTIDGNMTPVGTPLATPAKFLNSPAFSKLLSSSQKSFSVRLDNESQARQCLEQQFFEEQQKAKAEMEELKRQMAELLSRQSKQEAQEQEDKEEEEFVEDIVKGICEVYRKLEGPQAEAKARIVKAKETIRNAKPVGEIFLEAKEKELQKEKEHMKSVLEVQMQLSQQMSMASSKWQDSISHMIMRRQAATLTQQFQQAQMQQAMAAWGQMTNMANNAQLQSQQSAVHRAVSGAFHGGQFFEPGTLTRSQASTGSSQPIITATIPTSAEVRSQPKPAATTASTAPIFSFRTAAPSVAKPQAQQEVQNEESEEEGAEYEPNVHFAPVIPLPDEIEVKTGEEDEEVKFMGRAKLYRWTGTEWKERGIGDLKVLRNEKNGSTRIVMRRDQVHKLCANHKIISSMSLTPMQNAKNAYVWYCKDFSESESGEDEKLAARFKEDIASKFKAAFEEAVEWVKSQGASSSVPKPGLFASVGQPKVQQPAGDDEEEDDGAAEYEPNVHFTPVIPLPAEIEVKTGEEDEEVKFVGRSKLYRWTGTEWKERGVGDLKILRNEKNGSTRIVMRREQVHKLCANHKIISSMSLTPMQNAKNAYVWYCKDFSESESGADEKLAARFKEDIAVKFKAAFEEAVEWVKGQQAAQSTVGQPQVQQQTGDEEEDDGAAEYEPDVHFTPVIPLPAEIEVKTGEEEEEVKFVGRSKLYRWTGTEWKERGVGDLKILRNEKNGSTRIVMRREQVHKLCANHKIVSSMTLTPMQNAKNAYVWYCKDFSESESGEDEKLAARFKEDIASKFKTAFEEAVEWVKSQGVSSSDAQDETPAVPEQLQEVPQAEENPNEEEEAQEYEPDVHFAPVIPLPEEIEVKTGEEDEEVKFLERAKIYRWSGAEWKERGIGELKILWNENTGSARIVMRRDQIHNLCANHKILASMSLTPMASAKNAYVWYCKDFSESEEGEDEKLAARFKEDIAPKFKAAFEEAVEWVKSQGASSSTDKSEKAEQSTSTEGLNLFMLSTKSVAPKYPAGPVKLEDDEEEVEADRFENVTVKQFIGKFGEESALSDNFEQRGSGPLVLWHSKVLKRHRLTLGESSSINLLIGANSVHSISRTKTSVVLDCEDYASGTRAEERMFLRFGGEADAQRFSDVVGGIVEALQKSGDDAEE
ncbi:hypothetical protein QR680_010435 [Steinernema hermaphroditum]|uniref:RanBD1 domain-containing protein n=1 Tax=Steinernema hermaphroditum TaxID=289476 RepID=A0AA39INZ2_9BILA|nr:hypothetical protein QR680_010435 [Steinernema hermaphroditum]